MEAIVIVGIILMALFARRESDKVTDTALKARKDGDDSVGIQVVGVGSAVASLFFTFLILGLLALLVVGGFS